MSEASQITEVVFIDAGVAARSRGLVESLQSQGRDIVVLDPAIDGLAQMASVLAGHGQLSAIHVISHGEPGRLWLGGQSFSTGDLAARADQWAGVGASLAAGGDLLLYGCDVGAGPAGAQFLAELARLTGADVAASDDATGPAAAGGDQVLEQATGTIEAAGLDLNALESLLAPSVANLDSTKTFTEGGAPVLIDTDLSISGSSSYGGGYLDFSMDTTHSGDQFVLGSNPSPNANGAISVDGGVVYLGNGSGRDVIGAIDSVYNGQNGHDLRINFTSPFVNPSFEGNSSLGWTLGNQMVDLGVTQIAGWATPNDPSDPPNSGGDSDVPNTGSYHSAVSTDDKTSGAYSLRLWSNIGQTANGYDVVHGPYAYSSPFEAAANDVIYFDWRALAGGDAYDVFAYILNVNTGATQIILNETGANDTGNTNWATASVTIPTTGDWRFVFVAGTYDFTGGQVAGGSLYIDNVRVFGSKVNSSVISDIARQVTYQNTSLDSPPSRTLTIEAADGNGATGSASTTLNVTQLNNAPSFTGGGTLAAVNEDTTDPSGASVSSLFGALYADPDAALVPADVLGGIAIVADASNGSTQGQWQYSTDSGGNWHAVGTVSTTQGLLLPASSLVRFVPVANYHGTPGALSVHAVDSTHAGGYTSGTTRLTFDTTADGSDSAVSAGAVALGTNIISVNDAPVLTSTPVTASHTDTSAVDSFSSTSGTVTATDVDGDTLSFGITGGTSSAGQVVRTGTYGTLTINAATGAYTFVPNAVAINALQDGSVSETFIVTVSDGLVTDSQVFTFEATGANDLPVGVADTGSAVESGGTANGNPGTPATGNVLTNDTDPDTGATFSLTGFSHGAASVLPGQSLAGQYGTLTLLANGSYVYVVDEDNDDVEALTGAATLVDTFTYGLQDNLGATSSSTLSITIGGANEAPVAVDDTALASEASGPGNAVPGVDPIGNVLTNDIEPDVGDVLVVTSFSSSATLGTSAGGGSVAGLYGTLTMGANGSYQYVVDNSLPAVQALRSAAQTVSESFTYVVEDQDGLSDTGTLTVSVSGSNDTPVARDDLAVAIENNGSGNGTQGVTPRGNVLDNDQDPDSAANGETAAVVNFGRGGQVVAPGQWFQGTYGRVTITSDGRYTYDVDETHPAVQALGANSTPLGESFEYLMRDADGATSTARLQVQIRGANEAPTLQADVVVAVEDGEVARGNVLLNDVDLDRGDRMSVASAGTHEGRYGTLVIDAAGNFSYAVNNALTEVQKLSSADTVLTETFTYTVVDSAGARSSSTLTVHVQGSNDAPQVGAPIGRIDAIVGEAFEWRLPPGSVTDIDSSIDEMRYSATLVDGRPLPGWLRIDPATGAFSGTPDNGDEGALSVAITVTDANGGRVVLDSMTLDIHNPNDAPVWRTPAEVHVPESRTVVLRVQADDADGDVLTYKLAGGADAAHFALDPVTGVLKFVAVPDFEQPRDADADNRYEVIVEASDGRGGATRLTQWVTVDNLAEADDDIDGDGTPDAQETGRDTDGDGIEDALDTDDDGDSIDSSDENAVPSFLEGGARGDGNGDGVQDSLQQHVGSSPIGDGDFATLVLEPGAGGQAPGAKLIDFGIADRPDGLPAGFASNLAPVSFSAQLSQVGGQQTISLFLSGGQPIENLFMRDAEGRWYDLGASVEQVEGGWKYTFVLQDGGRFDADGKADGMIATGPVVASSGGVVPVYRFYNEINGVQFHTSSADERNALLTQDEVAGWNYEGIVFGGAVSPAGMAVWRFFHEMSGDHFYTATLAERDALIEGGYGYVYEGASFQAFEEQVEGTEALHRFFNLETADHYYTTDPSEHVSLIGAGYEYEGVLGYVLT